MDSAGLSTSMVGFTLGHSATARQIAIQPATPVERGPFYPGQSSSADPDKVPSLPLIHWTSRAPEPTPSSRSVTAYLLSARKLSNPAGAAAALAPQTAQAHSRSSSSPPASAPHRSVHPYAAAVGQEQRGLSTSSFFTPFQVNTTAPLGRGKVAEEDSPSGTGGVSLGGTTRVAESDGGVGRSPEGAGGGVRMRRASGVGNVPRAVLEFAGPIDVPEEIEEAGGGRRGGVHIA